MRRLLHSVSAYAGPIMLVTVSVACGFVLGLAPGRVG